MKKEKVIKYIMFISVVIIGGGCFTTQDYYTADEASSQRTNRYAKDCFEDSEMPDQYDTIYMRYDYAIFTGDLEKEEVDIEFRELITPTRTKWVPKKRDRKCLSADPNDCLAWSRVELPEKRETIAVLIDTTQSKNFKIIKKPKLKFIESGGHIESIQVVCENDITEALKLEIAKKLCEEYYLEDCTIPEHWMQFNHALTEYQKAHRLPIRHINLETLYKMGINYRDFVNE